MGRTGGSSHVVEEVQEECRVLVIGGGLGGLCATLTLLKAKIGPVVEVEQSTEVGGVWSANTYPGCCCDVPAHLYSFSFENTFTWSRYYPSQREMLVYLKEVVAKHRLEERGILRLSTRVIEARWNEEGQCWESLIQASDGSGPTTRVRSQFLIGATGGLVTPLIPEVKGLDTFAGVSMHTARWDRSVDLKGKRVGVIGTGASAIQVIAALARKDITHLTVFQRTAPWIFPKVNFAFPAWAKWLLRYSFLHRRWWRLGNFWGREWILAPVLLHPGGIMSRIMLRWATYYRNSVVKDPKLRKALTPDYQIGCKRVLLSDNYYHAMIRDNVSLVASGVSGVDAKGVTDSTGQHHDLDVIVWATGFLLKTIWEHVKIYGREGKYWGEVIGGGDKSAYMGAMGPNLPNFFFINGPNTGLGHNSLILMTEAQCTFIVDLIRRMDRVGARVADIKEDVWNTYHDEMQRRLPSTVWIKGGCISWYLDPDGKHTDVLWPSTVVEFQRRARRAADLTRFNLEDEASNPITAHNARGGGGSRSGGSSLPSSTTPLLMTAWVLALMLVAMPSLLGAWPLGGTSTTATATPSTGLLGSTLSAWNTFLGAAQAAFQPTAATPAATDV